MTVPCNMVLRCTLFLIPMCFSIVTNASDIKTTYNIRGAAATAKTEVADSSEWDGKIRGYLFQSLKPALLENPYVTSIKINEGQESVESYSWSDYETHKRTSYAFVTLNLPARVSMLFQIEESFRKCVQKSEDASGDESSTAGGDCQLRSELTVKGPVTVYGSHTARAGLKVTELLKNKQEISVVLSKSWDNEDTTMETEFSIESMKWEESLFRFMEAYNVRPHYQQEKFLTRERLLLGIARLSRQINERFLQ